MNESERARLRALLRAGDPAAGDPAPAAGEVARLRRTVLAAADTPRRSARHSTGLRWAAAGFVATSIGLGWLALGDPDAPPERSVHADAAVEGSDGPAPPAAPPGGPALGEPPVPLPERHAARAVGGPAATAAAAAPAHDATRASRAPRAGDDQRGADAGHGGAASPAVVASAAERPNLQLRVTAPGGTRIVWVLTPSAGP